MRVSVITPCLNPGAMLVHCLDSVSAQTYKDVEHIIVDGGSTDGTVELARSRGLRVISEPDRGQTDALNKGFALASGDYLGWLNADDWLVPHAVEGIVTAFATNPEVGWVYCDCEIRKENGDSRDRSSADATEQNDAGAWQQADAAGGICRALGSRPGRPAGRRAGSRGWTSISG